MPFDLDVLRNAPRRIEDGRAAGDRGHVRLRRKRGEGVGLQGEPMRVVLGGEGFADAGRAIAQPDIAIPPAHLTELDKAPMCVGHHEIRGRVTHGSIVSAVGLPQVLYSSPPERRGRLSPEARPHDGLPRAPRPYVSGLARCDAGPVDGDCGPAIPGRQPNPVTIPLSPLAFRKHECDNTPRTGTI